MRNKICKKCGKEKPINEFYKNKTMKDGYLNICKECKKEYSNQYRENNIEKVREYDRNRPNKEERYLKNKEYRKKNKDQMYNLKQKWRMENRLKCNCHLKVKRAIESGKLIVPKKCEICGKETSLQAHHTDYLIPLKVVFLCDKCHKEEHKKLNEIKRNKR